MSDKIYSLGLVTGRFQSLHKGHVMMLDIASRLCEQAVIMVGSSQESGTEKNPFTFDTRRRLLESVCGGNITICPLPDVGMGNCPDWGEYILKNVYRHFGRLPDVSISGKEARRSTWFNGKNGEGLAELYIPKTVSISATELRQMLADDRKELWRQYTDSRLWGFYEELREAVIASKDNTFTDSI